MPDKTVSAVDEKGRVLIPQSLRDAANLRSGERVILEFDRESRMLHVSPAHEKKLLQLSIHLADAPGSLAAAATVLASMGVDLVSTESHSSLRGESAVWVVECNPCGASMMQIKTGLSKAGAKVLSSKWL